MSIRVLELLLLLFVGVSIAYLVMVCFQRYGETVQQLQERKVSEGGNVLGELYLSVTPETFFFLRVLSAVVSFFLVFFVAGTVVGLVCGALGFVAPWLVLKRLRATRVRKIEEQLVEGLELLGNSLKSGLTLQQAVELLIEEFPPPISQEFSLVLAETRLGKDFSEALERMAERLNSNVVYILSSGVRITKQCGGDMTQIFSNLASTIREQFTIEGKLNAVTAQGRFQGLILGLMPFALIIILYFIDPAHVETLFSYQIGRWAVAGVVLMVVFAQMWIRKLLAIDV
jgi:tight adherence protein B